MPGSSALREDELRERAGYIQTLSDFASVAVAGIVITGLFSANHNLGGVANAFGNPYATLLLIKIGLVLVAATLGGANRFLVMPALVDNQGATARAQAAAGRFTRILQAEALVLFAVLAVAALLSATEPPMAP
jgi:putative copper resistance protein D